MAGYKAMYKHLFQQAERAVRIIQQAQFDCEEIYINTPEPKFRLLRPSESGSGPEPDTEPGGGTMKTGAWQAMRRFSSGMRILRTRLPRRRHRSRR